MGGEPIEVGGGVGDQRCREVAEACLAALWHPGGASMGVTVKTEVEDAARFWDAEDYHQQYLQKNGQDASKDAKETIRCYG